jgi:hypothetical protein
MAFKKQGNELIDKVKMVLNPVFVNNTMINKHPHINFNNTLTLHRFGDLVALAIHAEWFNVCLDFRMNISLAVLELIKKEYLFFPNNWLTLPFIYNNMSWFILYPQELEIAFDLKPKYIQVNEDAIENGDLVQYKNKKAGEITETYYTNDYRTKKRKSIGIIYNKAEKDQHDNKSKAEWHKQNSTRIEFRLCRNNSEYLNMNNFYGYIDDVIKRYVPLLAIIYTNYFKGNVDIHVPKAYKHLSRIVKKGEENKHRYRGKLEKTEPIPKRLDNKAKTQMEIMVKRAFLEEQKKTGNSEKSAVRIEKVGMK